MNSMALKEVLLSDVKQTNVGVHIVHKKSLSNAGQKEPVVLRMNCTGYDIVAGNGRVAALRASGAEKILALVVEVDDVEAHLRSLISNASRRPNPLHEARDCAFLYAAKWTQKQIADHIGQTQAFVSQRLALLNLVPELQDKLEKGEISIEAARRLARMTDDQQREALALCRLTADQTKTDLKKSKSEKGGLADIDIPDVDQPLPGAFVTGADMVRASFGDEVVIEWQGRKFIVKEVIEE